VVPEGERIGEVCREERPLTPAKYQPKNFRVWGARVPGATSAWEGIWLIERSTDEANLPAFMHVHVQPEARKAQKGTRICWRNPNLVLHLASSGTTLLLPADCLLELRVQHPNIPPLAGPYLVTSSSPTLRIC
jgi:hypothetical protein